jgi:hypothetical protein
MHLNVGKRRTV